LGGGWGDEMLTELYTREEQIFRQWKSGSRV
jgi:hypothetical protein